MGVTWQFIVENPVLMVMVFLPLTYIIFRDVIIFVLRRRELENQREKVMSAELKVEKMYQEVEKNRAKLLEDLRKVDTAMADMISDVKTETKKSNTQS